MNHKAKTVKIDTLITGANVRFENRYNIEPLAADISENGLKEPLLVWQPKKGENVFEVIRGHRRLRACTSLGMEDIPVIVVTGIDEEQALVLKVDQGNTQGLTKGEVQLAVNMLYDAGCKERGIVLQLAGLLESLNPMKGDKRVKYEELLEAGKKEDADTFLFEYRRGLIQPMTTVYRLPEKVAQAQYALHSGEFAPDVQPFVIPTKITNGDIKGLYKAFEADLKLVADNGAPQFSKYASGPNFNEAWQALVDRTEDNKPIRAKAMSAKAISEQVSSGKMTSELGVMLCQQHAGNKVTQKHMNALNKEYTFADVVRKHDAKLWEQVQKRGKEILGDLAATTK